MTIATAKLISERDLISGSVIVSLVSICVCCIIKESLGWNNSEFSLIGLALFVWITIAFLTKFIKSIGKKNYFKSLPLLVIVLGLLGGVFNLLVEAANGGKMPVIAKDPEYIEAINQSSRHTVANKETKFSFLADYQILADTAISLGDVMQGVSGWIVLFLSFRKGYLTR